MAVFARRFAPARCVLLETGTRIEVPDGGWPPGTRVLGEDGHVTDAAGGVTTVDAGPPVSRKLAINRLRERRPLDAAAVDRFLARHEVPIVEGARCTFLYRGEADAVFLVHRVFGLPDHLPLRRLRGTDLWYLVLELPEGSRVEYQFEVARGGQRERINDPLNPRLAHSPVGSSSVCYAHGLRDAGLDPARPGGPAGSLVDMVVPSRALRRDCPVTLYLPARFRRHRPATRC